MGVITKVLGQPQMVYFVKGAPEKVDNKDNERTECLSVSILPPLASFKRCFFSRSP